MIDPTTGLRRSPRRKSMPAFMMEKNKENSAPENPAGDDMTLPIMKSSRPSLVPGRGILKASNNDDNHTVTGVFPPTPAQTELQSKRKKSLHRRVSFAPEAAVRRFDPERESSSPQKEPRRKSILKKPTVVSPEKSPNKAAGFSPSKPTFSSQQKASVKSPSPKKPPQKATSFKSPSPKKSPARKSPSPKKDTNISKSPTPKKLPPQLASPSPASRNGKSPLPGDGESDMDISDNSPVKQEPTNNDDMLISFDSPEKPARKLYPELVENESNAGLSFPSIFNTKRNPSQKSSLEGEEDIDTTSVEGKLVDDDGDEGEQTMDLTNVNGDTTNHQSEDDDNEVTMDITAVHGRQTYGDDDENDQSMEMTRPLGRINEEVSDGEVSMDITRAIDQNVQPQYEEDGEEQTMDVTQSFGRIQDDEGMEMTQAVGRIQDQDDDNAGGEEEDDDEMDVTQALGKIQGNGGDGVVGEEEEEEEEMDATQALGVIHQYGEEDMEVTQPLGRIRQQSAEDEDDENDEMEVTQAIGNISLGEDDGMEMTRPIGSIQKRPATPQKNSPSKRQKTVTPQRGSTNRGNVATPQRTPSKSATPRRTPRSNSKPSTPGQQQIPDLTHPSQRTPSKSLQDSIMSMSPKRSARRTPKESPPPQRGPEFEMVSHTPLKSVKRWEQPSIPASSPAKTAMLQNLAPINEPEEDEAPNVPLGDFLNTIGIEFMDDFLTSTRGHSSFGLTTDVDTEPKLVDYVVAGQRIAVFGVFDFSIREMRNNVKTAKEVFQQFEDDTMEDNPLLFKEYLDASPDTKNIMNGQFKLMKTYAREQAKNVWYTWRSTLIKDVHTVLEKNFKSLKDDLTLVAHRKEAIEKEHNEIASKHAEMKRKLEAMRRRQKELETYDRDLVVQSQNSLAESKRALNASKERLEERTGGVRLVRESVEALIQKKRQLQEEITAAEKLRQENRRVEAKEIEELRSRFEQLQQQMGVSRTQLIGSKLQFMVTPELQLLVNLETKTVESKLHNTTDPCLELFHSKLLEGITAESIPGQVAKARQRWQNVKTIAHDLQLLQVQHMTLIKADSDQLTIKIRLHLPNSKVYIKVQMSSGTMDVYPKIQGRVSMSNVYGDECQLDETCGKLEATLGSSGVTGVSEECNRIIESV